jgi:hypothetical protein
MRTILISLTLAFTLPACMTDEPSRRDVGAIIDPTHVGDSQALAHRDELSGVATPEPEYYCDVDADCGPGLTCIAQRHTCFDERGRLAESDIPLGTIENESP